MAEYGRRLKTIDIAVGIFLVLAIFAVGYFALFGSHGQGGVAKAGTLEVHFIDVGQGDSILVRAGDKALLVDGGRPIEGPRLAQYLRSQGVNAIDIMVSTHPHADHIGGLLTVLKEFPVGEVLDSGMAHPTRTYESYLTLIDRKNIPFTIAEAGQTIDLGPDVRVEVLAPPAKKNEGGINENSIVLRIVHHGVSFLLMGDAGVTEEEAIMVSGYDLKSDVYKVPHHGSLFSASKEFLDKVSPEVSIIEVGQNEYGHPTSHVLKQLGDAGSVIYRTDLNGNVVVTSDGSRFTVSPQYSTASAGVLSCAPSYGRMRCTA